MGILLFGDLPHERREGLLARELARMSTATVDLGAHYGWYSRIFGTVMPKGEVICIEPDPITFKYVVLNTADMPNARCLNVAIGATNGEALLWRANARNLSSTCRCVGEPVPVQMRTLDDLCDEQGIVGKVGFVKCDVEGGEGEVLSGALRLLSDASPPVWMLEVSEHFLHQVGYSDADALLEPLFTASPEGKVFSQRASGVPFEIETLKERSNGNNVFFVPPQRAADFTVAANRAFGTLA